MTLPMSRGRKRRRIAHQAAALPIACRASCRSRASPSWVRAKSLDQVADFSVGGKIGGFDVAAAEALGGLAFGGEVFGLHADRTSGERLRNAMA